uniref:AIG1-type G domain-containing protein n=1 Tax=Strix occidentalis caurina TaxID=311401 RepID=A0A8D0FQW5_STROC
MAAEPPRGSGMRLLLVGKSRAGKMTTSNILLRERMFKFKSATKPVTVSCAQARCDGEDITVIDTADISDPREMYKEISHCIRLSSPGPHVLLLVTTLGQFIKEDKEATQKVQDISGADFEAHDHLTHAEDLARRPLHNFLRYCSNGVLQHLILQCGSRYCSFTNRGKWFSNDVYLEPRLTEKKDPPQPPALQAQLSQPLPICQILRCSSCLCRTRSSMSMSLWHPEHSAPQTRATLQPRESSCNWHIFLREIIN